MLLLFDLYLVTNTISSYNYQISWTSRITQFQFHGIRSPKTFHHGLKYLLTSICTAHTHTIDMSKMILVLPIRSRWNNWYCQYNRDETTNCCWNCQI